MDIVVPREKTIEQLRQDLIDSVSIIRSNVELYESGKKESYKAVVGQLRVLLCDSNKGNDNSLISKVFRNPRLHPLSFKMPGKRMEMQILFAMPGEVNSRTNAIADIFDQNKSAISLSDWLDQHILDPTITIRSLIRSVADKLASHVDSNLNEVLQKTSSTFINEEISHSICLIEISKYITSQLDAWIRAEIKCGISTESKR